MHLGRPSSRQRTAVSVSVSTEDVEGATHSVHFNGGSPETQEYARRFLGKPPSQAVRFIDRREPAEREGACPAAGHGEPSVLDRSRAGSHLYLVYPA